MNDRYYFRIQALKNLCGFKTVRKLCDKIGWKDASSCALVVLLDPSQTLTWLRKEIKKAKAKKMSRTA